MSIPASIRFSGVKELEKALQKLPENMQKRAYRSVLTSGGRVIASAAKKKITKGRTGLLKKAIRVKSGMKGHTAFAVIGASRSIAGTYKGKRVVPWLYSHLVEYGTAHSAAKPFLRPAVNETGAAVVKKMAIGLDRFLAREVKKLKTKGRF